MIQAIAALEQAVDTLIVVNNDQLLKIIPADTPVENAFKVADDVLRQVTQPGISVYSRSLDLRSSPLEAMKVQSRKYSACF